MTTQSKSALNQDLIIAARKGLIPVPERARLGGFGNMLRKELGQWWGTRAWWLQILIWVVILNGITTIIAYEATQSTIMQPAEALQETVQTFLDIAAFAVGIGTIITVQGAIIGEKELGTAAWVMSKPASRSAFILAKMLAYSIGIWISALIIPAIILYIVIGQLIPAPLSLMAFLVALVLVALALLFYLTMTLMLGTLFSSRGPVTGLGIGFVLSGMLLKGLLPLPVMAITPWLLSQIGGALVFGSPLPSIWPVPIVATGVWIVIMTAVALWRFGREEF